MSQEERVLKKPDNFISSFVKGANRGYDLAIKVIIPNCIFAFSLIFILNTLGIMDLLGNILSPVMGVFGLPGEVALPLVLAYVSTSGGMASAAALYTSGVLTPEQCSIVLPFIFLVGASVQYLGRILGPSGIKNKHFVVCIAIATINAVLSLVVMRVLLTII